MRTRRLIPTLAIAGVMGAGVAAGAVGQAGAAPTTTPPPSPVTTVAFSFSAGVTLGGPVSASAKAPAATSFSLTGNGVANFSRDQASVNVNIPAALASHLPGGSNTPTTLKAILSGGTVYVSYPGLATLTKGKPWVSITLPASVTTKVDGAFSKVASALGNVSGLLKFAQSHGATVTSLGTKDINGVPSTGHRVSIVLRRHPGGPMPAASSNTTATKGPKIPVSSGLSITAQVWADGHNRLDQASATLSPAPSTVATHPVTLPGGFIGGFSGHAMVNLNGYNSPVTITVPPASEVLPVPLSTVLGLLGGHHSH